MLDDDFTMIQAAFASGDIATVADWLMANIEARAKARHDAVLALRLPDVD